jgi:hypothetical protein
MLSSEIATLEAFLIPQRKCPCDYFLKGTKNEAFFIEKTLKTQLTGLEEWLKQ